MSNKLKITPVRTAVVLSVLLIVIFFGSKTTSGNKRHKEGNRITYNGNIFETNITPTDTFWTTDSATGERKVLSYSQSGYDTVIRMNGEPVYRPIYKEATLEMRISENKLKTAISEMLMSRSAQIPKGRYHYYFNNVIIDKKGQVVYYDRHGGISEYAIVNNGPLHFESFLPRKMKQEMDKAVDELISHATLSPLLIDGEAVVYNISVADDFTIR